MFHMKDDVTEVLIFSTLPLEGRPRERRVQLPRVQGPRGKFASRCMKESMLISVSYDLMGH